MKVNVFSTYENVLESSLKDQEVVVIDALRATSTIITALANGCKEVIPVCEIEEAVKISRTIDRAGFLLGGERNSVKIEGFNLSNSPLEYTRDIVDGRTVVITTTNGTRAIRKAAQANEVIIGAFLNISAVVHHLIKVGKDITILCAGTEGKYSIDDIVTAGALVQKLTDDYDGDIDIDDLSITSRILYNDYKDDLKSLLKQSYHYNVLVKAGFENDVAFCYQKDKMPIVPYYNDGVVRVLKS